VLQKTIIRVLNAAKSRFKGLQSPNVLKRKVLKGYTQRFSSKKNDLKNFLDRYRHQDHYKVREIIPNLSQPRAKGFNRALSFGNS
jgi:hypothetical protein